HAAVIDIHGRHLADQAFPSTRAGYQDLLEWVASHGVIDTIGVELTGSYGAALTRHLTAAGVTVREVNTTDKATRARRGKTDREDAYAAAEKTLAGMATAIPKDTTGNSEAIRALTLTRESAVASRTKTWNQLRALLVTAPAGPRAQAPRPTHPIPRRRASRRRPRPHRPGHHHRPDPRCPPRHRHPHRRPTPDLRRRQRLPHPLRSSPRQD